MCTLRLNLRIRMDWLFNCQLLLLWNDSDYKILQQNMWNMHKCNKKLPRAAWVSRHQSSTAVWSRQIRKGVSQLHFWALDGSQSSVSRTYSLASRHRSHGAPATLEELLHGICRSFFCISWAHPLFYSLVKVYYSRGKLIFYGHLLTFKLIASH